METLHKNIFKQPFFWTSVCSLLAVGIIVGLYSYAWVAPTASPNSNAGSAINFSGGNVGIGTVSPSSKLDVVGNVGIRTGNGLRLYNPANTDYVTISLDGVNVVQANYPWNFYGTGDHTISGSVGIGIADPVEKLEVAGNIKMTGMGNGIKFPDGTSQTTAVSSGGACVVSGNDIMCSGIPANSNGSLSITKNGVTCPIWKDCDSDGKTYGNGDCDESCATCYVGSSVTTTSPDGKDQNCNGTVDEVSLITCTPTVGTAVSYGFNDSCVFGPGNIYKVGTVLPTTTACTVSGSDCTAWAGGLNCIGYSSQTIGTCGTFSGTHIICNSNTYCTYADTDQYSWHYNITCAPYTGCTKAVSYK
jgi:hypothetical protein